YASHPCRQACAAAGLRHLRTKPYTPRTNGKAERFIQTSLREWAYAQAYPSSPARQDALVDWLEHYNTDRPRSALAHQPPAIRLGQMLFLGSTDGTVSFAPTWLFPRPQWRAGARIAEGDRRPPALSVLDGTVI